MSSLPQVDYLREVDHRPVLPDAQPRTIPPKRPREVLAFSVDALMLLLSGLAAEFILPIAGITQTPLPWLAGLFALTLGLLAQRGMYRERGLLIHLLDQIRTIVSATAVAAMAVIAARVLLADEAHNAAQLASSWLFATFALVAGRAGLHAWTRSRIEASGGRPTLIVGAGKVGHLLARRLIQRKQLGLKPIGFLDNDPLYSEDGVPLPILGASWDLEDVIADRGVEHVIFTFSTAPHEVLLSMVKRCEEAGVTVSYIPRLFEATPERVEVEHVGGLPIVTVQPANPRGWQFFVKYAVDRVVAASLLLVLSPPLALLALASKLSTGAVLFRQPRVGLDGREFEMLKFRTMRGNPEVHGENDADWASQILGEAMRATNGNGSKPPVDSDEDRRTGIGRLMRKASLDELPQLWNVVRGDMSLVGPRPERATYVQRFQHVVHRYDDRHRVKSGITGWAQVHGLRGKTSLADRVEWDNYYIENWSLWLDLKILVMTAGALVRSPE